MDYSRCSLALYRLSLKPYGMSLVLTGCRVGELVLQRMRVAFLP